ncbi:hypothetical protein LIER_42855 [Lithospermum erythrorhizon]|uniref:Uncharacterized protein n=1 Tax=Lithospermum erythrorhizon TaxID=34254 RepID=A0AAV3P2A0_LITER
MTRAPLGSLNSVGGVATEVRAILLLSCNMEHDNKENIPPFSTMKMMQKQIKGQSSATCILKRRFRRPLRDITHLFNHQNSAALIEFQSNFSSGINMKKRKAAEEVDSIHKSCSKILRKEFR